MKFNKYILENSVPEWRTRYINYGKLKKLIKRAVVARATQPVDGSHGYLPNGSRSGSGAAALPRRHTDASSRSVGMDDENEDSAYTDNSNVRLDEGDEYLQIVDVDYDADEDFFAEFVKQIRKANRFYTDREMDANSKLESLREQCEILAQMDTRTSTADGTTAWSSAARQPVIMSITNVFSGRGGGVPPSVTGVYGSRHNLRSASGGLNMDDQSQSDDSDEAVQQLSPAIVAMTTNPRERLQKALLEFYRMLELLKNFRILNEMAIQKILKKFEKATGLHNSRFRDKVKELHFVQSMLVETQLQTTEHLYADFIDENKDRRAARKVLRVPDVAEISKRRVLANWRSGFLSGLAIPPIVFVVRKLLASSSSTPREYFIIQLFGGLSIPIVMMYLFALCLQIWDRFHINWVLVFELDPREYMQSSSFMEMAAMLLLLFGYSMYFAVIDNPLPMMDTLFYPPARIVFSGCFEVQGLLSCDLMISMTYSFVALQNVACIVFNYNDPFGSCATQGTLGASLAAALPAAWRLLQCFRRYYDHRTLHPHMTNAVKYLLSLTVIFLSTASRNSNSIVVYAFWIIFSFFATVMAYSWDVLFDWGLFSKNRDNPLLRTHILYPKWLYFGAVGLNAVLRFGWVFLLAPSYWAVFTDFRFVVYIVAMLEIFRRFVWAIIRMENEHSTNVGKFRAVKELPLPFRINMQVNMTSLSHTSPTTRSPRRTPP
ncbi:EXS family-domain-containing protein [Entophlyctis helioformis]|nr:EXS family-domain-containing protein [Entophlyctis helioformis]